MKKSKKKKKNGGLILVIIIILLIALYYWIKDDQLKSKINQKIESISSENNDLDIVDINSNKRPIAIMIDNNIGNSNHIGLAEAYITYEISVEGGLSRMMALFKDRNTSIIGPVRSSRHYFLDYALESDAIYAHYGWSPYAQEDIKKLKVNNINGLTDSNVYWRDKTLKAPHNVFTSIENIYKSLEAYNYKSTTNNWQLLNYDTDEIDLSKNVSEKTNLKSANNITVKYSNYQTRSYKYDSKSKTYLRYMNNNPHTDKKTKEQYKYKNIIIEKIENTILDSYGRLDLKTTGTGDGYYITNGYLLPITWEKSTRNSKTIYKYLDNTEIKVNDGNTFIQIIPAKYDIEIQQEE